MAQMRRALTSGKTLELRGPTGPTTLASVVHAAKKVCQDSSTAGGYDIALITTDLTATAEEIIARYAAAGPPR